MFLVIIVINYLIISRLAYYLLYKIDNIIIKEFRNYLYFRR